MRKCDKCGKTIKPPDLTSQHDALCPESKHFQAIRPYADQEGSPGRRLRVLQSSPQDLIEIHDETTLPERINMLTARRIESHEKILLTVDDAQWLLWCLREILE